MATLPQIRRLAATLHCELDENGPTDLAVFAPKGFVFKDSDCHAIVVCTCEEPPATVRRDMLTALQAGLEPCACDECQEA